MLNILRKFYRNQYRFQNIKILGRVACLGNEIINMLGLEKSLINHQKSRVDFLLELSSNSKVRPVAKRIYPFLERVYISGTIKEQESDFFGYNKPNLIFMDSFSELTDQIFMEKNSERKFLANYSDVKHDKYFKNKFDYGNLILIEDLYKSYDMFFNKVFNIYPNTNVIFIHFPTTLDTRNKFRARGDEIFKVINELMDKYSYLHSVHVEDKFVFKSEEESDELKDFPYHYGKKTYQEFQTRVEIILKKILNV